MSITTSEIFVRKMKSYPLVKLYLKEYPENVFQSDVIDGRLIGADDDVYGVAVLFDNEIRMFNFLKHNVLVVEQEPNGDWLRLFE